MKLIVKLLWFSIKLQIRSLNNYQSIEYDKLEKEVQDYLDEE